MLQETLDFVKQAPSEALVGLAGVVFGSLLTTFGVWLTNRANLKQLSRQLEHEERLSSRRLKKERLEELYILICHWNNLFFSQYLQLTLVMKGHIDYNQYNEAIAEKGLAGVDFNRIEMIIDIYGNQLGQAYDDVNRAKNLVNKVISNHKAAYLRGESGYAFLKDAGDAQLLLGNSCDELKLTIAEAARNA